MCQLKVGPSLPPRPCVRSSIREQIYWGASVSKRKISWFCKNVIKFNFLEKFVLKQVFYNQNQQLCSKFDLLWKFNHWKKNHDNFILLEEFVKVERSQQQTKSLFYVS